ncbi:MAG: hypothetical protein AAFX81_21250 [Pseudomonadota bacterium]
MQIQSTRLVRPRSAAAPADAMPPPAERPVKPELQKYWADQAERGGRRAQFARAATWFGVGLFCLCLLASFIVVSELSLGLFEARRLGLDGLSTSLSVLGVLVAAILAYVRFFYNRTFAHRANIDCEAAVFPLDQQCNMHALRIVIENKGNRTVDDVRVVIIGNDTLSDGSTNDCAFATFLPDERDALFAGGVVEVGEMKLWIDTDERVVLQCTRTMVPHEVRATTYIARMYDAVGNNWQVARAVRNDPAAKG